MGGNGSLGLIHEVNQPFLDLPPSNSFQMYTFYWARFSAYLLPLIFLSTPSSLLSPLLHTSESPLLVYSPGFFLAIDPQPSASINPALSVWSLRQIYPHSPEFTLWLCFITSIVDNQYELGVGGGNVLGQKKTQFAWTYHSLCPWKELLITCPLKIKP